ncbi:hypothetical protein HanRHA438_Chr01g0019461 [Helianthus annuus]|uniref:Uncharacterized protein n=1 Tax=Helianthus annuus TaxID=4232 RepID=A0A9K3JV75_HELAN|nr:hypothetical protein HanXRQr2_Chr01g0018961 [Helianthus annuus]KAJ0611410.1 hypothetical protein HanHA300_Chr01g0015361 [Helianthus annuus]KAJ0622452.1 hypothetical protein HanIR_Chr01g0020731 [Helianthus annuus]KAJ0626707.1 hypothetical protein HanHA89_Chr01g0016961 [Helianthus annuus]KAJ0783057.1 hypothetical protein HanLR1_Chr01g0015921 [Helianthus annuus]
MCPLRIILIFLSATLAGFFVLRNLKSQSDASDAAVEDSTSFSKSSSSSCVEKSSHKVYGLWFMVYGAFVNGFWTCVDMASGRYLWRNLVSVSKKSD